jgi:hypothetical protein
LADLVGSTTFRVLGLFSSSGDETETPTPLGALERADFSHWVSVAEVKLVKHKDSFTAAARRLTVQILHRPALVTVMPAASLAVLVPRCLRLSGPTHSS